MRVVLPPPYKSCAIRGFTSLRCRKAGYLAASWPWIVPAEFQVSGQRLDFLHSPGERFFCALPAGEDNRPAINPIVRTFITLSSFLVKLFAPAQVGTDEVQFSCLVPS